METHNNLHLPCWQITKQVNYTCKRITYRHPLPCQGDRNRDDGSCCDVITVFIVQYLMVMRKEKETHEKTTRFKASLGIPDVDMATEAKPPLPTLKFGFHGNVREASEDCYNFVILLLTQKPQHVPPVRVLQTHQVLNAPYFILMENASEWVNRYIEINMLWKDDT